MSERFANIKNYLSNSAQYIKRHGKKVAEILEHNISVKPWGKYGSDVDTGTKWEKPVPEVTATDKRIAGTIGKLGTDQYRKEYVWGQTNPFRIVGDVSQKAGQISGLSPLGGAAVAFGLPALYHVLTETSGPLNQGLRPKGWKAVAPVSTEEDPTGRTPRNLLEEAGSRFILGQKSQPLIYSEFQQERPDIAPSTLANYRRYLTQKPPAGERFVVDPERQTFSALGGVIKGTARGLHDPEIRIKGTPISLNATLGTAAGLGTLMAGTRFLNPPSPPSEKQGREHMTSIASAKEDVRETKVRIEDHLKKGDDKMAEVLIPALEKQEQTVKNLKQNRFENLNPVSQKYQKLGALKEPTIIAGGALAAIGTAAIARKLFQMAEENRIKKEDPVEYLRYKHGDLATAKEAMKKPEARNWQELSQFVK